MKLRLGIHLDGQYGRHAQNRLGVSDVGPLGLLTILETQLGLVPPQGSPSERIVQYRDCLLKLDGSSRFFHESLAAKRPASSSESTSLRAQPMVTIATVRLICQMVQRAEITWI